MTYHNLGEPHKTAIALQIVKYYTNVKNYDVGGGDGACIMINPVV